MIFVLEGLPGTGKTTISKMLEKQEKIIRIGEILDKGGKEILPPMAEDLPQKFFLQSDKLKYKKGMSYCGKDVVIDRGVISTITYNSCLSNNCNKEFENKLYKLSKNYLKNTVHIYIKINPALSLLRKKKIPSSKDLWSFKKNLEKTKKIYDNYFSKDKSAIIIDGNMEISKLYQNILHEIKEISK